MNGRLYRYALSIALIVLLFLIFSQLVYRRGYRDNVRLGHQVYLTCSHHVPTVRTIEIVMAADDNYARNCAVTMASILLNSDATSRFKFHILDGGITEKNKHKLLNLRKVRNFEIHFYDMTKFDWSGFPDNRTHISLATYYRLMMTDILPNDLKKVLYLDCDMIIEDDVRKIWDIDIE